jgi:hypothetical protein
MPLYPQGYSMKRFGCPSRAKILHRKYLKLTRRADAGRSSWVIIKQKCGTKFQCVDYSSCERIEKVTAANAVQPTANIAAPPACAFVVYTKLKPIGPPSFSPWVELKQFVELTSGTSFASANVISTHCSC